VDFDGETVMKTVVIVQARMGSSRLPGKVLLPLCGQTVLAHVIERCRRMRGVDEVMIATTQEARDAAIEAEALLLGVRCWRGSEDDVVSRYYEAARSCQADVVVRVTSDCPLLDPEVSSEVLERFIADKEARYVSNTLERSYPRGLDTEVFEFSALQEAYEEATENLEREHVTPFLYRNPERFHVRSITHPRDFSTYRWTLDTPEDWELIQAIYAELYHRGKVFSWQEAAALMERRPELATINAHIEQKKLGH
jgi:spore coat polysaccharide biosynthesis protein SpsF